MSFEEFLLHKLAEECAEVAHVAHKAMQHGLKHKGPNRSASNETLLRYELWDIEAVVRLLSMLYVPELGRITTESINHKNVKIAKLIQVYGKYLKRGNKRKLGAKNEQE